MRIFVDTNILVDLSDIFSIFVMVMEILDMASGENNKILESARILERWENTLTPWEEPYLI